MKLPFIHDTHSKWPTSKETQERVVNPSHDMQLQDHLVDELMSAKEHKDNRKFRETLMALIHSIMNEEADV